MWEKICRNCCGAREGKAVSSLVEEERRRIEVEKRKQAWDFLKGYPTVDDMTLFDEAFEKTDIPLFIKLLDSDRKLENIHERLHPWAAPPTTIAALSATQLAILSSKEDGYNWKDAIRIAGGTDKIIRVLSTTDQRDLIHACVVCLSFLSEDNDLNCSVIYNAGGMVVLMKLMDENFPEFLAAVAQTLRNIYVRDMQARDEFVALGGIQKFTKLLKLEANYDPESLDNQLEAVYHLEDLVMNGGEELGQYVKQVKQSGALYYLKELERVEGNKELQEAAKNLAMLLED